MKFDDKQPELAKLAPGNYTLVVEAAREVGGRELLKIPFTWPAQAAQTGKAQGSRPNSAPVTLADQALIATDTAYHRSHFSCLRWRSPMKRS